jgi:lipopolysaccharide biosynthesis glycosyltransferase
VEPGEFSRWKATAHPYIATMMDRFKPPFQGEYVLMLDADIIAVDSFDELFAQPVGLSGVIAHGSPFSDNHESTWSRLFERYGLERPQFAHEHSGWLSMFDDAPRRFTPFYLNTGVVFGPTSVYERLFRPYFEAIDFVRQEMDSYFFEQIALTLAAERSAISTNVVPLRYNFPNQPEFDSNHAAELEDVRLLHFLRTPIIDRERDFFDYQSVVDLIARKDLSGSNEILRNRLGQIPFSRSDFAKSQNLAT